MRESRNNIRYANVSEMLLAKQRAIEQAEKLTAQRVDRAVENAAWAVALGIMWTVILLVVAYQEGWF